MFDAYTIKKVLPRLVAAVVLIQLSWFIFTGLISLTNLVAFGLEALIAAPFGGAQNISITSLLSSSGVSGGSVVLTTLAIGAVGQAAAGGLIAIGGFILLALVVGYLTLTIRWLLLIALLLVSPLALVAWILPGTQRIWKMWWENFSKLLIMFPLIAIMITAGQALGSVVAEQNRLGDGSIEPVSVILILACIFTPFFLIPATYKAAGAGLAFAAGWIGGKASGVNDGLSKRGRDRRGERSKERRERTHEGNLMKGGTSDNLRGRINRAAQAATLLPKAGLRPTRMRHNLATARGSTNFDAASKYMKENEAFSALSGDDDKLWAIMQGGSEETVRSNLAKRAPGRFTDPRQLEEAVSEVMRARREGGDEVARIAATRAQAGTGTGFESSGQMLDSINAAAGGDRSVAGRMLGEMRGAATQSGRVDLGGAGFADMAGSMDKLRAARAGGPAYSQADATSFISKKVLKANSGGALLGGKKNAVEALAPEMLGGLDAAMKSGDVTTVNRELAALAGRYDAMGQIAPQNAEVMAEKVLGTAAYFDSNGQGVTVQKMIEDQRNDPAFLAMRREYASTSIAQANANAAAAAVAGQPVVGGGPTGT